VKKLTIHGTNEFCIDFALGDIDVLASVGPKTRHEIMETGFTSQKIKRKERYTRRGLPEFSQPADFIAETYCELVSTCLLDVEDETADLFLNYDVRAKDEIFKIADRKRQHLFTSLDYVAGFIDLHFDYSLTRTLVSEETYAYYNDHSGCTICGHKAKSIGSFELNKNNGWVAGIMQDYHKNLNKGNWEKKAQILGWLLRAWDTRDLIHKFVSLFFIIERIIPKRLPMGNINKWKDKRQKVLALVQAHANPEDLQEITEFVKGMKNRLSLPNRFESWASRITLPGWEKDVTAFKLLNEKRNELINAAKLRFELRSVLNSEDVRIIEAIAIRYIRFALFGNGNKTEKKMGKWHKIKKA
jgi:hypothetical protein